MLENRRLCLDTRWGLEIFAMADDRDANKVDALDGVDWAIGGNTDAVVDADKSRMLPSLSRVDCGNRRQNWRSRCGCWIRLSML